jgi:hypothetical protein
VLASGGIIAIIACLSTVTRYLPSAVTSVLAFRCGVYSSLRDNSRFHVLFGSAVWGLVFSGGLIWAFISLVAFGFAWETTRDFLLIFLAQIIGILVTLLIKIVAMQLLRRTWYGGFYRKHPAGANIFMVFIECWNIALSSGYILARSLKFIILSILYIARVDTPFLSHGVGWLIGNIPLDVYPISFAKVRTTANRNPVSTMQLPIHSL